MRDVWLVAAREFRQIVATRGFWIMLLIVPVALAVSGFASSRLAPTPGVAYTVFDPSGRYGSRIDQRIELDHQRRVLRELATYAERWKLAPAAPEAPWARRGGWLNDAEVRRFMAEGGAEAALSRMTPRLPEGAARFEPPPRLYQKVPLPVGVPTGEGPEAFAAAIAPHLKEDIATSAGELPFAFAIYLPPQFGAPGVPAQIWTNGRNNPAFLGLVQDELTGALRAEVLTATGMPSDRAQQVQTVSAPIAVTEPPLGEERGVFATRSIIPIALVYLLLITAFTTGSMLLQGLVEERSNKLLESVLACIRPAALMRGKLLGLGGVGLGIILVWAGCAVVAALSSSGMIADVLRGSLASLSELWMVPAMILYFLAGYLIVSMLFLGIGALSDSIQDAQAYLAPVLILIMLPVMLLMQVAMRDPDAVMVHVLSWIPIYTPFAMLARMGSGVSVLEVGGTLALLAAFVALELAVIGRLFEASILNTGKPGWRDILAQLRRREA